MQNIIHCIQLFSTISIAKIQIVGHHQTKSLLCANVHLHPCNKIVSQKLLTAILGKLQIVVNFCIVSLSKYVERTPCKHSNR